MKRLLIVAALVAVTLARPETYKEKEDFQYSRSSTDEGSKSGYYGAQRGNMGGNYEKAHNMDTIAQSQMSGLVRQVHGELGDGANTRVGNVYGSGSTRGVYGQGYHDLSNLSDRNFNEGEHYDSSLHSASSQRAGSTSSAYGSQLADSYRSSLYDSQRANDARSQSAGSVSQSNRESYGSSSAYNSRYSTKSGSSGRSDYGSSSRYNQNNEDYLNQGRDSNRRFDYIPIRVVVRPGTNVDIPFNAQTAHMEDFEENRLNSEAKSSQTNRGSSNGSSNGSSTGKHYESSYNYRKEWEKHDSSPQTIPLSRPSESSHESVSDDYNYNHQSGSQSSNARHNSQNSRYYAGSSNREGFNSDSQTREEYGRAQQRGYQRYGSRSAHEKSDEYNADVESVNNLRTSENVKSPKRYESSFSYHKSWERRGDPYVIHPGSEDSSVKTNSDAHSQKYRQSNQQYQDC